MAVLTSAGITFGDATTQSTAATAAALVTTTNVLSATAGASVGAVGTYAMLLNINTNPTVLAAGSTIAGSALRYAFAQNWQSYDDYWDDRACNATVYSGTPSGTWRHMGHYPSGNNANPTGLFLRIS
jgi:uncharacterized membrane protein YebE (DUF533 family)